ncbi:MAG: type III-A CRISPR-associated RAMP protein Csm5 [Staphylothermus sp.]|nr:type III-A CRISPR-associated RAMP protein Csm5 [Staphylothermus sp.]
MKKQAHVIREKYNVELEVMTEVHVGNNKELLLGHDVIVFDDNAYVISMEKLFEKILRHTKGLSYSKILKLIDTEENIIQRFFKEYMIKPEEVSMKILPILDKRALSSKTIMDHIKLGDHYLIPGSEIKGLFRTAILYKFVKTNKEILKQIIESIDNLAEGYIDERNIGWSIEKVLKRSITLYYSKGSRGPITQNVDILKYLQVTDPIDYEEKSAIDSIVITKRTNPFKELIAVNPIIALNNGTRIRYELSIHEVPSKGKETHQPIRELYNKTMPELMNALKEFSLNLIEYERNLLKHLSTREAQEFYELLGNWQDEVKNENNTFYLKIGYGTGMYSKTIFMALDHGTRNKLIDTMSKLIKAKTRGRISYWDNFTLKLVGSKYNEGKIVPFGWIKLKTIKK